MPHHKEVSVPKPELLAARAFKTHSAEVGFMTAIQTLRITALDCVVIHASKR